MRNLDTSQKSLSNLLLILLIYYIIFCFVWRWRAIPQNSISYAWNEWKENICSEKKLGACFPHRYVPANLYDYNNAIKLLIFSVSRLFFISLFKGQINPQIIIIFWSFRSRLLWTYKRVSKCFRGQNDCNCALQFKNASIIYFFLFFFYFT